MDAFLNEAFAKSQITAAQDKLLARMFCLPHLSHFCLGPSLVFVGMDAFQHALFAKVGNIFRLRSLTAVRVSMNEIRIASKYGKSWDYWAFRARQDRGFVNENPQPTVASILSAPVRLCLPSPECRSFDGALSALRSDSRPLRADGKASAFRGEAQP
jgi:hypothetical protein